MTGSPVRTCPAVELLDGMEPGSVKAIITSPPYTGLPGRGDTRELVGDMLASVDRALHPEYGTVTMIVGSAPGNQLLPLEVADLIEGSWMELHSMYVWDRTGMLERKVGPQTIGHDYVIHACRYEYAPVGPALWPTSVIRTEQHGFNYGHGVTTPPDLAALLVDRVSEPGDLIVDPFAGLAEIGVQAIGQGRLFAGSDIDPACAQIANARIHAMFPTWAACA